MSKQENIIQTKNLSIGYTTKSETITISENINLSLEKGKLIALIGENGIGKSTLLKTLTGLIPPLKGEVTLLNKSIQNFKPLDLAQELSIVLTEKLPPSNLTVYEIIALGRQPYTNWLGTLSNEDKIKIDEAIALTEIQHLIHKKHDEISDGQLQIALIARALAQDTSIIILDEPTTHLDLVHKATLLKLLLKLTHETGKTILYSTHDIDLAIQMTDKMIVFTPTQIVIDQPCNLIQTGIFNTLFDTEHLLFDATIGKFKIK
ncbi:ABC transporter ATP-binding protein [Flavobacterium channae]|uniref:ABC transporter ATP-binding protein n=1 Tax=Flavobacterium channae TaxID=2897181 RepID=UPI001E5364E4|nr:ABC transporter ATP-binding protein [Flavobacterium channae]UGS24519.1 ABC transporter ATP-binding protein [Flavobacterium channae]